MDRHDQERSQRPLLKLLKDQNESKETGNGWCIGRRWCQAFGRWQRRGKDDWITAPCYPPSVTSLCLFRALPTFAHLPTFGYQGRAIRLT